MPGDLPGLQQRCRAVIAGDERINRIIAVDPAAVPWTRCWRCEYPLFGPAQSARARREDDNRLGQPHRGPMALPRMNGRQADPTIYSFDDFSTVDDTSSSAMLAKVARSPCP